jgi:predicted transcriptional regulator
MISNLELRQIIESGFLPLACNCRIAPDGFMTVQLSDPHTGHIDLLATGIAVSPLASCQAIAQLVDELKYELTTSREGIAAGRREPHG